MGSYTGGHNANKRKTMKNQNRSAALGRPAKLQQMAAIIDGQFLKIIKAL